MNGASPPARVWTVVLLAMVAAGFAVRLPTMPVSADGEDSLLFVRGVIHYSIAKTSPHFPGYPVYIWIGKLLTFLVGDPVLGLHLLSAAASALTAWPLALVARAWALSLGASDRTSGWCGWATAGLWLVTPIAWIIGAQILSDPLGLLCGATLLALCVAGERRGLGYWIAAAMLGGVMLGVRLVNVSMLGPVVAECWRRRRERWHGLRAPYVLLLAGLAGVLPWLFWLVIRDPMALLAGARSQVGGHFTRWGESIWTDHHPLTRPFRAFRTLAIYGLGTYPHEARRLGVAVAAAWIAVLAMAGAARPWRGPVSRLVALWAVPHLLHVFLAHDIDYPRYMLSAVALLSLVGGLAPVRLTRAGLAAVIVTVAAMAAVTAPLAIRQSRQPPVELRVVSFLARRPPAALAVVEHEGLPFFLDNAQSGVVWAVTPAEEVPRWQSVWERAGREVFATEPPPQDPSGWRPVAHFCRDPRINPYLIRDLWLFAPVSGPLAGTDPLIDCEAD